MSPSAWFFISILIFNLSPASAQDAHREGAEGSVSGRSLFRPAKDPNKLEAGTSGTILFKEAIHDGRKGTWPYFVVRRPGGEREYKIVECDKECSALLEKIESGASVELTGQVSEDGKSLKVSSLKVKRSGEQLLPDLEGEWTVAERGKDTVAVGIRPATSQSNWPFLRTRLKIVEAAEQAHPGFTTLDITSRVDVPHQDLYAGGSVSPYHGQLLVRGKDIFQYYDPNKETWIFDMIDVVLSPENNGRGLKADKLNDERQKAQRAKGLKPEYVKVGSLDQNKFSFKVNRFAQESRVYETDPREFSLELLPEGGAKFTTHVTPRNSKNSSRVDADMTLKRLWPAAKGLHRSPVSKAGGLFRPERSSLTGTFRLQEESLEGQKGQMPYFETGHGDTTKRFRIDSCDASCEKQIQECKDGEHCHVSGYVQEGQVPSLHVSNLRSAASQTTKGGAKFIPDNSHPELGAGWTDPSGLFWGPIVQVHLSDATPEEYCRTIGGRFPTPEELARLNSYFTYGNSENDDQGFPGFHDISVVPGHEAKNGASFFRCVAGTGHVSGKALEEQSFSLQALPGTKHVLDVSAFITLAQDMPMHLTSTVDPKTKQVRQVATGLQRFVYYWGKKTCSTRLFNYDSRFTRYQDPKYERSELTVPAGTLLQVLYTEVKPDSTELLLSDAEGNYFQMSCAISVFDKKESVGPRDEPPVVSTHPAGWQALGGWIADRQPRYQFFGHVTLDVKEPSDLSRLALTPIDLHKWPRLRTDSKGRLYAIRGAEIEPLPFANELPEKTEDPIFQEAKNYYSSPQGIQEQGALLPRLLDQLNSRDWAERDHAVRALNRRPEKAVEVAPKLLEVLGRDIVGTSVSEDGPDRRKLRDETIQALVSFGPPIGSAVKSALQSENRWARQAAIEIAASGQVLPPGEAIEALGEIATKDSDEQIRRQAVRLLSALKSKNDAKIAYLQRALSDEDLDVRHEAEASLVKTVDKTALARLQDDISHLGRLIHTGTAPERLSAARQLSKHRGEAARVVPILIDALDDKNREVQGEVVDLIRSFGSEAAPGIRNALDHADPKIRRVALWTVASGEILAPDEAAHLLIDHATGPLLRSDFALDALIALQEKTKMDVPTRIRQLTEVRDNGKHWVPIARAKKYLSELVEEKKPEPRPVVVEPTTAKKHPVAQPPENGVTFSQAGVTYLAPGPRQLATHYASEGRWVPLPKQTTGPVRFVHSDGITYLAPGPGETATHYLGVDGQWIPLR